MKNNRHLQADAPRGLATFWPADHPVASMLAREVTAMISLAKMLAKTPGQILAKFFGASSDET